MKTKDEIGRFGGRLCLLKEATGNNRGKKKSKLTDEILFFSAKKTSERKRARPDGQESKQATKGPQRERERESRVLSPYRHRYVQEKRLLSIASCCVFCLL